VREFESAVELQPGHLKAHNYLGLALAQAGQYGRAREHFVKAGSEAMAEKMAKALAAEARPVPVPPRAAPPAESKVAGITQELPVVTMAELASKSAAPIPLTETVSPPPVAAAPLPTFGNGEPAAVQQFPPPAAPPADPPAPPRTLREAAKPPADAPHPAARPTELTTVAGKLPGDGSRTFTVTPEAVRVEVRGEVLVRTAGLLGWTGVIEAKAEFKRFRGRVTDKPFGWGPARM